MRAYKGATLAAAALWIAGSLAGLAYGSWHQIKNHQTVTAEVEKLADNLKRGEKGERVFLAGSSPVFMGISAEKVHAAMGVPAANLAATNARDAFSWYASLILDQVKPGDVLVIADPTWDNDEPPVRPDADRSDTSCATSFKATCLSLKHLYFPYLVQAFWTAMGRPEALVERGKFGDYVFPASADVDLKASVPRGYKGPFAAAAMAKASAINREVRARGGCPVFVFAPFLVSARDQPLWQAEFGRLFSAADVPGDKPVLFIKAFPGTTDKHLIDMKYGGEHPSRMGRERWTDSVINGLRGVNLSECLAVGSVASRGQ